MKDVLLTSESRERLKAAFLKRYAEKPWEEIKVSEIAEMAGYSRGTFYRYFTCTEDVLRELEAENTCTKPCRHIIERASTIDLTEATDAIVKFYEDRADVIEVLAHGDDGLNYLEMQQSAMTKMFSALLGRALDSSPLQGEVIAEYVASAKVGLLRIWLKHRDQMSLSAMNNVVSNSVDADLGTRVAQTIKTYGVPTPVKVIEDSDMRMHPWEKDGTSRSYPQ